VAKSYTYLEGADYFDTFWVTKIIIVRVLLVMTTIKGRFLEQIDVKNAFFYVKLYDNVYMLSLLGLLLFDSSKVCKLHKSLYGLKQANR